MRLLRLFEIHLGNHYVTAQLSFPSLMACVKCKLANGFDEQWSLRLVALSF